MPGLHSPRLFVLLIVLAAGLVVAGFAFDLWRATIWVDASGNSMSAPPAMVPCHACGGQMGLQIERDPPRTWYYECPRCGARSVPSR